MTRTLKEISRELLHCAEELSEAVNRRELTTVESLLGQRQALLVEMSCIEVPMDDGARRAIDGVRELDLRTGEDLSAMRSEVADELGRVRSARRSSRDTHGRVRPSSFVSTRC